MLAALSGIYSQGYLYGHVHGMLGALHPLFLGPFLGLAVLLIATLLTPARTTEPAPSALLAAAALNADMVEPAHGAQ